MKYDFIIVGAGPAGCVLANRLSKNPNHQVCLIEVGPSDKSVFVKVPAGVIMLMRLANRNWKYWTKPQKALDGRSVYIPRGKTLGGSSAINAMCYSRGHPWDYDHWASLGNKGWGYKDILPLFRRSEHYEPGADEFHGEGGPLNISELRSPMAVSKAFVEAGVQAGYPKTDDFNNDVQEGVGLFKVFQKNGERFGAAPAYLHPVMDRPNLTVMTDTMVTKVVFDGKRATGVEAKNKSKKILLEANKVILSGGAINSPQLLKLSGIGPKEELKKHNIPVLHDLPGVGENLQDHPDILVVKNSKRWDTLSLSIKTFLWTGPIDFIKYIFARRGFMTTNVAEAAGFVKTRPEEKIPDVQFHFSNTRLDNHGLDLTFSIPYGYSGHVCVLRPKARGNVTLQDANPETPANIDPNLLGHPDDVDCMLRGLKVMQNILAQDALKPWEKSDVFPGKHVKTDEQLKQFLVEKADNIYHPVGTCKMGHDDMAVVDDKLKVHGLDNLYVIDASIMPTLVGGNTTHPTVMIAEKGADMILEEV